MNKTLISRIEALEQARGIGQKPLKPIEVIIRRFPRPPDQYVLTGHRPISIDGYSTGRVKVYEEIYAPKEAGLQGNLEG